jgi:L-galactose dehydrogenase
MKYRTLGKTGLRVTALSYGASALGGAFGPIDEAEGIRCVRATLDLGVNYIDVSPYYGLTKAETVLGRALRGISRDKYYLATKVGRYGESEFDFSAARVTRSVDESLRRLQVDYVDLIQCHDIEFVDLNQIVEETLPALEKVRAQGKARFVGITGLPLRIYRAVMERAPVDTVLSYCHYCLNDTSFADLIPWLRKQGVGIINAAPLAMGLLTQNSPPSWHPASAELKVACARAAAHCRANGSDLAKLAIQFAVANAEIDTTVVGTAKPDEMRRNIRWTEESLDKKLLAEVLEILKPVHNQTWPSGRGENN